MKQTAGKVFARDYFYHNYLSSFVTPRQLRNLNILTLLGEDFRELELLHELGIPPYRVFSVERDHAIYKRQQEQNREEGNGVALYYSDLADFVHTHLKHHAITAFNLDICGSYLRAVDPVLGELLMHVRKSPQTVMATYHSAARDKPQLMEGLKSLIVLLWLAPEVIDRLVRHFYGQYRSAELGKRERNRDEVSRNMLLRNMFWLRSHMEHIMIGSCILELTDSGKVSAALREQEKVWERFVSNSFPVTYAEMLEFALSLSRPQELDVQMDLDFGDVEFLTYAANDGFYHNCYFATFESSGSTVPLDAWLAETSRSLRQNKVVLIDAKGDPYASQYGRLAVDTDRAVMWDKGDLELRLRQVVIPPSDSRELPVADDEAEEAALAKTTVEMIRRLARENPSMDARELSQKLSLQLPIPQIAAHMAVARRKSR